MQNLKLATLSILLCVVFTFVASNAEPSQKRNSQSKVHADQLSSEQKRALKLIEKTTFDSPWGSRSSTGQIISTKDRAIHASQFAAKIKQANLNNGVVATRDGVLIPSGNGHDGSKQGPKQWSKIPSAPGDRNLQSHAERVNFLSAIAPAKVAELAAKHIVLGIPTAGLDTGIAEQDSGIDLLLVRSDRVQSYNLEKNTVNWTSYSITPNDTRTRARKKEVHNTPRLTSSGRVREPDPAKAKRLNDMRPDHSLPMGVFRPSLMDYYDSGFDPGHQMASADRRGNKRDQSRTNVYTNMIPQAPSNNRGPWVAFEGLIQKYANEGWTIHVTAGHTSQGETRVIGNGVAVPDSTWKVAVFVPPEGSLVDDSKIYSIDVPNRNSLVAISDPLNKFATTVSKIEVATNYSILSNLPPTLASKLRHRIDESLTFEQKLTSPFANIGKK